MKSGCWQGVSGKSFEPPRQPSDKKSSKSGSVGLRVNGVPNSFTIEDEGEVNSVSAGPSIREESHGLAEKVVGEMLESSKLEVMNGVAVY